MISVIGYSKGVISALSVLDFLALCNKKTELSDNVVETR